MLFRSRTRTCERVLLPCFSRFVSGRVEHVFGCFVNEMGGKLVRTIGIVRARTKIGLTNLTHNMMRFVWLEQMRGEMAL